MVFWYEGILVPANGSLNQSLDAFTGRLNGAPRPLKNSVAAISLARPVGIASFAFLLFAEQIVVPIKSLSQDRKHTSWRYRSTSVLQRM
jgi:hypothetical protein